MSTKFKLMCLVCLWHTNSDAVEAT